MCVCLLGHARSPEGDGEDGFPLFPRHPKDANICSDVTCGAQQVPLLARESGIIGERYKQ